MKQKNTLILILKKKWYDMIDDGIKQEEYRDLSPYWRARIDLSKKLRARFVQFRNGYRPDARRMTFRILAYDIRKSNFYPEWGEPFGYHYVIMLGRRVGARKTK